MEKKKSLKELRDLVLENKIVKVKPIVRPKPYLKRGRNGQPHDGEHTYTGCSKAHGLPYSIEKRSYLNPFLDEQKKLDSGTEQEAFEILLDQKEGALNLYKYKINEPNFWGEFTMRIPKEGLELNLNNPADALRYRIFLVNPRFANNQEESKVLEREYIIVDEKEQKIQASLLGKKKSKAEDYMYKLKKNKKDMIDTLRLLGKAPSRDADIDWLREELYKIKDEVAVSKGVPGLDKFLEVMEDPTREIRLFVLDAIEGQHVIRNKQGYIIERTNKFIGRKLEEVIDYFKGKSPEVKEELAIIQEQLKN
jgi:hypothetical protein